MAIGDFFIKKLTLGDFNVSVINTLFAIGLVAIGILIGIGVKKLFKRFAENREAQRTMKPSFMRLIFLVIEWCIYILFVSLALDQLKIPEVTQWLVGVLIAIPALVGALILIVLGFVIATYLKDIVEESKILNWHILSNVLFYFILYVFLVFALKTAFISIDVVTVNILIIILTVIFAAWIIFNVNKIMPIFKTQKTEK